MNLIGNGLPNQELLQRLVILGHVDQNFAGVMHDPAADILIFLVEFHSVEEEKK